VALLIAQGVSPHRIAAVTFTNKGAPKIVDMK
jgi:superfamily I DNA/RNA helicase